MSETEENEPRSREEKRERRLKKLEALHARGFWAYLWDFSLYVALPTLCISIGNAWIHDEFESTEAFLFELLGACAMLLAFAYVSWRCIPGFLRLERSTPVDTGSVIEANCIQIGGCGLLTISCYLMLMGLDGTRPNDSMERVAFITTLYSSGLVLSCWGLWSLERYYRRHPQHAPTNWLGKMACLWFFRGVILMSLTLSTFTFFLTWRGREGAEELMRALRNLF